MNFDKDLECRVLGMCLVEPEAFRTAVQILSVNDFGFVDNQLIFVSIQSVFESTGTVDPVLVAKDLQAKGELKRVGGPIYLYDLSAVVVETDSIKFYCEILKELSVKRKIDQICAKAKMQVSDEGVTAAEALAELTSDIDQISGVAHQLESMTALELMNMDIKPVQWVVPTLIPDGLTILAGDAKIGKSFFGWNIAIAVATGGIALSEIKIDSPRNVTYLALEDPPALLKERLDLMTNGDIPNNLHIINNIPFKFDNVGLKILENYIEETKSELIIVDTWRHVCPDSNGHQGSAYDVDYQMLIPVQNFAHSKGIAMMLITHTRKANDIDNVFNQIQGSMGIQAGCDTLMMLCRANGSHSLHVNGRRILQEEYAMILNDGIWQLEGTASDYNKSEARKEILEHLLEAGDTGLRYSDVLELTEKSKASIKHTLRRMLCDGDILQPHKRGAYFHPEFCEDKQLDLLDDGVSL